MTDDAASEKDVEISVLKAVVDAFLMVDKKTAIRILQYLESRFVDHAESPPSDGGG